MDARFLDLPRIRIAFFLLNIDLEYIFGDQTSYSNPQHHCD
jgi:hypothetical protein